MSDTSTNAADIKRQKIQQTYETIKNAFKNDATIELDIIERVKGGFRTTFNEVPIFLPTQNYYNGGSLSEEDANALVGTKVKVKIMDITEDEFGKVIRVSNRKYVEDEKWNPLVAGSKVQGAVKSIHENWLIMDVNGVDGFVHISQLSRQRVNNIDDFVKVGDVLTGEILIADKDAHRLSLSLRNTTSVHWDDYFASHKVGDIVKGKATRIVENAGVAFELATNVEGFMRMSEASYLRRNVDLNSMFTTGEEYELEIILVDVDKSNINLSYKRAHTDNWSEVADKYEVGATYTAVVSFIPPNGRGADLIVNDEIDGFIPKQRMLALYTENKPNFKRGDTMQVKLMSKDAERHSLMFESTLKQENPYDDWGARMVANREQVTKPDVIHNMTLGDLLSQSSKKSLKD
jgi:ribosomal protein S1